MSWIFDTQLLPVGEGRWVAFDGQTLVFVDGANVDPVEYDGATGVATQDVGIAANGAPTALSIDGDILAVGDGPDVSVFRQVPVVETRYFATINPLVLLLGDQAFVRLTLGDPPPAGLLRRLLGPGLARMTAPQRLTAARAMRANIALLAEVQGLLEAGVRVG